MTATSRWLTSVALALAAPALAADPALLFQASLEASGGAAWKTLTTLHLHYRVERAGQTGQEDVRADVRTGRYVTVTRVTPFTRSHGFDGVSPWATTPDGFPYLRTDADSVLGAANESYRAALAWWFPERHPATLASLGTRAERGRTFELVSITPAGGRPFTVWIDRRTHLIDRTVEERAEDVRTVHLEDYRLVHGLRLPFTLQLDDEVRRLETVEIDPHLSERSWALPPKPHADEPAGPVTVPIRLVDDVVLVDVMIDGQGPYEADFDTGADLLLTPTVASDLKLSASGRWKETGGGEGSVTVSAGSAREVSIDAAKVPSPAFDVFEFNPGAPRRILVGSEFLHRYVVRLDFDALTMTLTPPDQFDYRGPGAIVPFHFQSNQPEVDGSVDGIAGTFAVDTGDDGELLLIAGFARRHRLIERYHAEVPYGGSAMTATSGVLARAHTVELDGADGRPVVSVDRPLTRISTQQSGFDADRYVSGNLGIGILKQFNVTFDYPRRRLIFEKSHLYGVRETYNRSGMRLRRDGAVWKVSQTFPGKPAAQAGLQPGDELVQLGGRPVAELDAPQLKALLIQPPGTALEVLVRRGTSHLTTTLTLQEVIAEAGLE